MKRHIYRVLSVLLSAAVILNTIAFSSEIIKVDAATTEEMASYIESLIGTPTKEWGRGTGTQCVELPKYYVEQFFGIHTKTLGLGNGNTLYKGIAELAPETFEAIDYYDGFAPREGNIISYHSQYSKAEGHAALVYHVDGSSYSIAEQSSNRETVGSRTVSIQGPKYGVSYTIICVARPRCDICNCSESYAGQYIVSTQQTALNMRSGHSTSNSLITKIPKGEEVTVSKGNGEWAHISWNGYSGLCSMAYLTKKTDPIPEGEEMTSGYGQCLPDGDYFIFSQLDPNYYVDVSGAAAPADAGTNVAMWHLSDGTLPSAGDAHDAWTLHYVGNGFYTIAQKGTGMYLDVFNADKKRGTNVQLWTGHGGTAQLWSITPTATGYKIQAKCSSYCLDVAGAGTDNGTNVQVWESNDSGSQRFAFVPFAPSVGQTLADGIYMIQLKADPAFCLDVQGYENTSYTSETNVQLWKTADCNDAFQVTYLGDGYYSICEVISGLTLDVIGVGGGKYLNTGNNIQVYKNNLTRNQKWIIRKASSGGYQIISAYSGYALDLSGGVPELRCQISQYYDNGTNAQIWEFGEALTKPEKSVLSADKASAFTGETVTFTADSDTATGYTIGIDKDGERLITQAMPDGKLSISFADAGEYSAYVTAYNAMGYCDSKRIAFTVKPYELTLYETEKHTIVMQDAGTTYKTSNADVAVVSKNGVITAMGKGAAVITVTDGSAKQVQIVVQVFKAPVTGDCTADGVFDSDDVAALCEWLTTESAQNMNRWENADLNEDGLLNAVDLTLMKQTLLR